MLLAVYSHYMVNDPFERCGPALVFTFMLGGRLVVWYQVREIKFTSRIIRITNSPQPIFIPDEPKGGLGSCSSGHRRGHSEWIEAGLRRVDECEDVNGGDHNRLIFTITDIKNTERSTAKVMFIFCTSSFGSEFGHRAQGFRPSILDPIKRRRRTGLVRRVIPVVNF